MTRSYDSSDPRAPVGRGTSSALLVVDMLHDYDHADGDRLRETAAAAVPRIAQLIGSAAAAGVPVIYVNDNHDRWQFDRRELVEFAREAAGPELIDPIAPPPDAPFVMKARHSAFYGSSLEYLLTLRGVGRLVLTGQVTEQCILYSALDAYIRHFRVVVPADACAAIDDSLAEAALEMMRRNMHAEVTDAASVRWETQPKEGAGDRLEAAAPYAAARRGVTAARGG